MKIYHRQTRLRRCYMAAPAIAGMRKAAAAFGQHLIREVCGMSIKPFQPNTAWETDRDWLCFVFEMKWRKQNGAGKERIKPYFTGV